MTYLGLNSPLGPDLAPKPKSKPKPKQRPARTSLALVLLFAALTLAFVHIFTRSERLHQAEIFQYAATPDLSRRGTAPSIIPEHPSASEDALQQHSAVDNLPLAPLAQKPPRKPRTLPTPSSAATRKPVSTVPATSSAEAPTVSAAGDKELRTGRQYLSGEAGNKNSAEGAKWLWKAVALRNTSAELALADLYQRGEGVPKNCEQAKILLDSAAKRGVDEASAQLRRLNESNCQ